MRNVEILKSKLMRLEDEMNFAFKRKIKFHQQGATEKNMSFSGGDGRIWIQPFNGEKEYDISLSGISITKLMSKFMCTLCSKDPDGYKFPNKDCQPFWRVGDFELVEKAVKHYATTK